MIKSFKDNNTESIWNGDFVKKIPEDIQKIGRRKLRMLNSSIQFNDLKVPPANHLEKLKNDRQGQYSIRINDQWRVCFVWRNGHSYDVQIVDYH